MRAVELSYALEHARKPDRVRVPHRPATMGGEAVAVDVDDVDVAGAQGDPLLEEARALVHERVDGAVHDLVGGDVAWPEARLAHPRGHDLLHRGIGERDTPAGLVAIPAGSRLLAEAAQLAQAVGQQRPRARRLEVPERLADPPAHVEAGEVARLQRAHGHAERTQGGVHGGYRRALLHHELRFALVERVHAVADEPAAV